MDFVGNLLIFAAVKEFCKSITNWQSYSHGQGGTLFFDSRCSSTRQWGHWPSVHCRASSEFMTVILDTCLCLKLAQHGSEVIGRVSTAMPRVSSSRSYLTRVSVSNYTVSQKKGATLSMAITSSILDRFPKFFHCCKEQKISNKIHIRLPTTP